MLLVKGSALRCSCFFTENFFSRRLRGHFRFVDKASFLRDYDQILRAAGVDFGDGAGTGPRLNDVLEELETERRRRQDAGAEIAARKAKIARRYRLARPEIFALDTEAHLAPDFRRIAAICVEGDTAAKANTSTPFIRSEEADFVFSFPVFSTEFCRLLIEEINLFEASNLPKGRPNTMNRHGILLDELLDFETGFVDPLRRDFVQPIAEALMPGFAGVTLDSQKAFIVKYDEAEDVDLSYHYDNAEVTLNVCLGTDFDDGQLYFGDVKTFDDDDAKSGTTQTPRYVSVPHAVGRGVLHRGLHRHGALPISRGQRYNLILWFRASSVRNRRCPMCGRKPDLVDVEDGHDGFCRV